ncbi:enoyl-CoA hydratase/isomerase family protein [Roseomonas terrae]|uniref:Enoyl-CoA hydratase/isomerase family protein n=1 Tax=Neoroseomonas terrae TaxID=424799 RepID=A0ABS5EQ82_9PROT|nr:enoyl-CoA hydratase/isomerase family protein [Neoroseomonas terrae]MBR0653169.1 enoyl-CoA hydratase/isomerase family protein [Neoroseomonas terrae]
MPKFFQVTVDSDAIATLRFARPPVNAMSDEVYAELREVSESLSTRDDIRVLVVTCPDEAKAWCAGADLKELRSRTGDDRAERYAAINAAMLAFYNIPLPVIGALDAPVIGVGMVWASLCDMRVGAKEATFSLPEIQRGMAAGLTGFFNRLSMPEALLREMMFTGDAYSGEQLAPSGFFNQVVPRAEVKAASHALAMRMAKYKSSGLRTTKIMANKAEHGSWLQSYQEFQRYAVDLSSTAGSTDGINSFLSRGKDADDGPSAAKSVSRLA